MMSNIRLKNDLSHSPTSPDLSPISTSSALLTPTDLSPAKAFDQKLPPSCDFGGSHRSSEHSSLLFETGYRMHDGGVAPQVSFLPASQPYAPEVGYFPQFDPFLSSPVAPGPRGQSNFSPSAPAERRRLDSVVLPPSLPPLSWNQQRYRTASEWLRTDDGGDRAPQYPSGDVLFRSFQTHSAPPQRQGPPTHEVSSMMTVCCGDLVC